MQESVYYENLKYWKTIFVIKVYLLCLALRTTDDLKKQKLIIKHDFKTNKKYRIENIQSLFQN